jgi:hypothetical protein
LKLTKLQRLIVAKQVTCLPEALADAMRQLEQPLMLTQPEMEDLGGFIASESKDTPDPKLRRTLDAVQAKIQKVLDTMENPEPRPILPFETEGQRAKPKAPRKKAAGTVKKAWLRGGDATVFQFKITLRGSTPPIWRRIQVEDCTLDQLHEHIQNAMGWTNSHLHDFNIGGMTYGNPALLDNGFDDAECEDSTKVKLSAILPRDGNRFRFLYQYDFGDGWEHDIHFEKRCDAAADVSYPVCLDGARACPPEDVGGVWGYANFLEAIANPSHEQHEDMREWGGGNFDSEAFDAAETTKYMKGGVVNWRLP